MKNIVLAFLFCHILLSAKAQETPLDDITSRQIVDTKIPLSYAPIDERDIFWEKRIWRVIDVREKMNLPFMNPKQPFFQILTEAAEAGEITLYDTETDDFRHPLNSKDVSSLLSDRDTVQIFTDTETMEYQVVENMVFYEDIKRYRVKEVWYFDSKSSEMKVRILGIAPLREIYDDNGNFRYEKPLFWVHYPSARQVLAKALCFTRGNDAARTTWEDLFEKRQFSSVIYKQSDVLDRRLEDMYSGTDRLLEADKIKNGIFNFEQDAWSK